MRRIEGRGGGRNETEEKNEEERIRKGNEDEMDGKREERSGRGRAGGGRNETEDDNNDEGEEGKKEEEKKEEGKKEEGKGEKAEKRKENFMKDDERRAETIEPE